MHDGTKVKAQASGKSFRREPTLREHLEQVRQRVRAMGDARQEEVSARHAQARERAARERVERLERALDEVQKVAKPGRKAQKQPRVSETDPEARFMKQSGGGYAPRYNLQISTDAAHTLIVGVRVTQSANDQGQLPPALEEVKRNLGELPRQVVADAAYTTRETLLDMAARQVDFIGPRGEAGKRSQPRPGIDAAFRAQAFIDEAESDTYGCPAGKELLRQGIQHGRAGVLHQVYSARTADGRDGAFRKQCCAGASPRRILRAQDAAVVEAFKAKMRTTAARAIYRLRSAVAEFPNAWLKAKIGLRQFRVRGLKKVRCEALWACLAYNLSQGVRLRWKVRWAGA